MVLHNDNICFAVVGNKVASLRTIRSVNASREASVYTKMFVCVCVCTREREVWEGGEREREREVGGSGERDRKRERESE